MDIRGRFATGMALLANWALHRAGRQGSTVPGRVGLKLDPGLLGKLAATVDEGVVVVCGTNGKTTTNNMIYQALKAQGKRVAGNLEGANMLPGVTAALAKSAGASGSRHVDWACLEVDEFSAPRIVPQVKPTFLVLLDLFRDQLDRYGEIDIVIDRLIETVKAAENLTVIYNADDPLCARVAKQAPNQVAFGVDQDLNLPHDLVVEGRFCLECGHLLSYRYRQYGQLGDWYCEKCGNARPALDFAARDVDFGKLATDPLRFSVTGPSEQAGSLAPLPTPPASSTVALSTSRRGAYMLYNIMAAWAASCLAGVDPESFQRMLAANQTSKGRMEGFTVDGVPVVVNLAKNPTGFNQNIGVCLRDPRKKAVVFIVNSQVNDGHDISWLWDVDYERLAAAGTSLWYAGGERRNDLQVRLKYAGIPAKLSEDTAASVKDAIARGAEAVYVLPNYSALVPARDAVAAIAQESEMSAR
ncbi:MAG: MurT ligase domain-containing protein [Coriobacteriales bacterium]|nr:MurT ligase domain-containing protein [Coriobacteriales bacterium]